MNDTDKISETLRESIYQFIKESIIKNEIRPNETINKRMLMDKFKASMTPIKDAIIKLQAEGYVTMDASRNAVAREISHEEFIQMNKTMALLDEYACLEALHKLSEDDLETLQKLTEEMETYCNGDTLEKYLEINSQIHIHIWNTMKNDYLFSLIKRTLDFILMYDTQVLYSLWSMDSLSLNKYLKYHRKLLEALKEKDKPKLKRIVKNHWPGWSK